MGLDLEEALNEAGHGVLPGDGTHAEPQGACGLGGDRADAHRARFVDQSLAQVIRQQGCQVVAAEALVSRTKSNFRSRRTEARSGSAGTAS